MAKRELLQSVARGVPGPRGPAPLPVWTDEALLHFEDANGNPLSEPQNLLGPEGPSGDSTNYLTRARAVASIIPVILMVVRVLSFADGYPIEPAYYKPGASDGPMAFQDVASNWWELDLSASLHYASWYGVGIDGADYSAQVQQAFTWAAGIEVRLPAGVVGMNNPAGYVTTVGPFAPALRVSGASSGLTIIDNRCTSGAGCIYAHGDNTIGSFARNGFVRGIFFKTTTGSVIPSLNLRSVYNWTTEDCWFSGMAANGATITNLLGDADASNIVRFRLCYFINCLNAGLLHDFAPAVIQTSFVICEDCFFQNCLLCGWYFIGLSGTMIRGAMTECGSGVGGQGGLWVVNNAATNGQFAAYGVTWENNYNQSVLISSLSGGGFYGCEIAGGTPPIVASVGINMVNTTGLRIEGTRMRVPLMNPFTAFKLGGNVSGVVISNTQWRSFDDPGQKRYDTTGAGIGNRIDDTSDCIQVGSIKTDSVGIVCVNGANHDIALPPDGAAFQVAGPSAPFSVGGLQNGWDGRGAMLYNASGQVMTITHNDGASTAGQRIFCPGGVSFTVPAQGTVTLRKLDFLGAWAVQSKAV